MRASSIASKPAICPAAPKGAVPVGLLKSAVQDHAGQSSLAEHRSPGGAQADRLFCMAFDS